MAFAQGAQSSLTYVVESVFGDGGGGTPAMIELPYNTHSLDLVKARLQTAEIRGDRMTRIDRHGNRNNTGDIVVELRDNDYDDFIESAMFSTFNTAGDIKVGTTPSTLAIEDWAADIGQSRFFTGLGVSDMAISIGVNQMVQATFSMVGSDMVQAATRVDATPTATTGGEPFDGYSGTITEGGGASSIISSLNFTLSNSLSPIFVLGSDAAQQLEYGLAIVEGTVEFYYQDAVMMNKFLNETESSIVVTVDDPTSGGSYTFTLPRVKYNGASVPVNDPNSRLISMPFVALRDATEATNLKITKN